VKIPNQKTMALKYLIVPDVSTLNFLDEIRYDNITPPFLD
jgi:hypothetical protein